jgi:hypothetical protein
MLTIVVTQNRLSDRIINRFSGKFPPQVTHWTFLGRNICAQTEKKGVMSKFDIFRSLLLWLLGLAALWRVSVCRGPTNSSDSNRRLDDNNSETHRQRISIIIPARNEEHNLPNLLHSLRGQSTEVDEVIVVDDQSTDHTAMVARGWGAKVVDAGELPAGWMGKTRACWVGAGHSAGSLLVFLDADTTCPPMESSGCWASGNGEEVCLRSGLTTL